MTDTPADNAAAQVTQHFVLAKQNLSSGKLQEALNQCLLLESLPVTATQHIEQLYLKAVVYRYLKQYVDAQDALDELLALAPDYARGLQEQGHLHMATSSMPQAAKAFYQATLHNPALVGSWRALAKLYHQQGTASAIAHVEQNLSYWSSMPKPLLGAADLMFSGQLEQADRVARQFLRQQKHHVDGLYILAITGIQAKAYDEAEFLLESAIEIAPTHLRAKTEYAALLNRIGKYQQALAQAESMLTDEPENLSFQVLKGVALVGMGQLQDGIDLFKSVLAVEPERASLWLQLGHAYKSLGQLERAVETYQKALKYKPDYGDVFWSLANTKAYRFSDGEISQMRSLVDAANQSMDDRIHTLFALGKGLEDKNDAEGAFGFYAQGNAAQFAGSNYSAEQFSRQVESQIRFFTPQFFAKHQSVGSSDPAPIFILGLPRAGSTLLEQILSSHSQVDATQELHNILSLAKRLRKDGTYPQMLDELESGYFERFGQQFIEQTQAYRQGGAFFIDKMPNNFLHVGLIKLILPNAKVIDARREPLDCGYSCFKQLFAEGQDFTYDLSALGSYYRDYLRLMEHWQRVLPGFVLQVDHEDVLEDLEGQVRRMLAFCQLDFEPQCLTFYNNERAVQTPSAAQVREPINKKGVGRWRAIEDKLAPFQRALGAE